MGWPEAMPDKKADTTVCIFINNYLPIYMWPHFILSDNGTEFKNQVIVNGQMFYNSLVLTTSFLPNISHKVMDNWRFSINTFNLFLRNFVKRIQTNGANTSTKYLAWIAQLVEQQTFM